jgi:mRNA interferase MazF
VVTPAQGDVWWAEAEDKRRPVLVVTRSEATPVLNWIIVAPVTRTIRRIPTEIPMDDASGLTSPCVASFDNLQPIRKSFLTERVGTIESASTRICRALSAFAGC